MAPNRHDCFASCLPGLEAVVAAELDSLAIRHLPPTTGGVPFHGNDRDIYLATVGLRSASRVLVRIAQFPVRSMADLEKAALEVNWIDWFPFVPEFKVTAHQSRVFHTGAIDERLRVAATSQRRKGTAFTPLLGVVRMDNDECTISVCAAGDPLHRRGWRGATGKAPLRPTLAAAMLQTIGWDGSVPLVDPMCGSGTIPIEAARLALGRTAGLDSRPYAFQQWPRFQPGTWGSVKSTLASRPGVRPTIVAADRNDGAVSTTTSHLQRAGVADVVSLSSGAVSAVPLPDTERGWVVTNPPWGGRIDGGGDLRNLYASLGQLVADRPGWSLAIVTVDHALARATGLQMQQRLSTTAGGRRVMVFTGSDPSAR